MLRMPVDTLYGCVIKGWVRAVIASVGMFGFGAPLLRLCCQSTATAGKMPIAVPYIAKRVSVRSHRSGRARTTTKYRVRYR
jgi:hypothetical protein